MPTVKPIDREAIHQAVQETKAIITVEEHSIIGGLGGAVAEVIAQYDRKKIPFRIMGIQDCFCREVGDHAYLRQVSQLSTDDIIQNALNVLKSIN